MPRKYKNIDHFLKPDPVFRDRLIQKFVNNLMECGKRSTAQKIFYHAMEQIKQKIQDKPPGEVFNIAIDNIRPRVEVKSRRVGGATYQVPVQVKERRSYSLAMKWLITSIRSKKGRPMENRLADELVGAYRGEGNAIKKRDDVHKMAEANRAFAHLAY